MTAVAKKKTGKRKRRGKKCRHPCECGWRVRWTTRFRRDAVEMGLWESVKKELKDIEKRLRDPGARPKMLKLLREYCPYEVVYRRRRYPACRIYVGRQTARALLVIREDLCRVWFVSLRRAAKKYRRLVERP